jgi:hypothetical protein
MKTLADLCTWLEAAPEGTTLSAQAMLNLLRQITGAAAEPEAVKPIGRDMTLAEVGEIYSRRPNTVRDWVLTKGLRAYLDATGQYRITPAALEEWQEAQRQEKEKPKSQKAVAEEPTDLGEWRKHFRKAG